jgi:tetratricopeptide (TPR) repeat protein
MFMIARNGKVLAGNNEDSFNPLTKMWFVPAPDGKYGVVYFGYDTKYPQGGMNEKGLVFDGFATRTLPVKNSLDKPSYRGHLTDKVMKECSTVKEALDVFSQYNLSYFENAQLMFVDKTGDSVIIEGDAIQRKKGDYQVATNFYLSQYREGADIPDQRYKIATKMLEENEPSIDLCRKILNATHQEGRRVNTLYSNIYDINEGLVYLYNFHNFEETVVINLKEELKKGYHVVDIPSLFSKTHVYLNFLSNHQRAAVVNIEKILKEKGIQAAIDEYHKLREKNPETVNQERINTFAYKLLRAKNYDAAITFFKLNVEAYPKSANVFDSLAEAYEIIGNTELAIKYYKKALEVLPNDKNIRIDLAERIKEGATEYIKKNEKK